MAIRCMGEKEENGNGYEQSTLEGSFWLMSALLGTFRRSFNLEFSQVLVASLIIRVLYVACQYSQVV